MEVFSEYSVTIKHHSTSSQLELVITSWEEPEQGAKLEKVESKVWMDYSNVRDLVKLVENLPDWMKK